MKAIKIPKSRRELKVGNITYRSFYDFSVTEDDLKRAHMELGETEEVKSVCLLKLKEMLKRDKDFYYRLDDAYLLRHLRCKKYDVKKAYTSIRNFYAFRKERPDLFVIPSNLDTFLSRDILKCPPYRDKGGSIIHWIDINQWKPEEMSFTDVLVTALAYSDVESMNPSYQISGLIGLWDMAGLTASHVYQYANPTVIRTFLKSVQASYPWRIKQIIVVNSNIFIRGLFHTFKFLLPKKVNDRLIMIGSDITELHKYINPCLLPKTYGGCIETSECTVAEYIKHNLPYIIYERTFGRDAKV